MPPVSDQEFDQLISRAMDELPQEYIKGLDNVAILYADDPNDYQKEQAKLDNRHILLGLYEGIPLTQRGAGYSFVLPDKITLFKNPLLAISENMEDFFQQIKRALWHEIAHYYGLSHADMDRVMSHGTGHDDPEDGLENH